MINQSFSVSNLLKLVTHEDYRKYEGLGESKTITTDILTEVSAKITKSEFKISSLKTVVNEEDKIFNIVNIEDDFAIRKINDTIKRFYKVKQADRNLIVNQIIALLKEAIPMAIIKLDIKKFYESLDRKWLLEKLKNDSLLSVNAIKILSDFFDLEEFNDFDGLPRGIGISATLSELFLRDFDRKVNRIGTIYYYARYVDDIIIFTTSKPDSIIKEIIDKNVLQNPLEFNTDKTKVFEVINYDKDVEKILEFEYLGYKFLFSDCCKKSKDEFKDKAISVSIANKKVKKYKTRMVLAFLDFFKNNDFELLEDRLKFLTGNYPIKRNTSEGTVLYAGLYYNYPFLNNRDSLRDLTIFLRKTINAKNKSFGAKMNGCLSADQKEVLSKYSFVAGWQNRKINSEFRPERIKQIKKCWHNG